MIAKVLKRKDLKGTGSANFADTVSYIAGKVIAAEIVNLACDWRNAASHMRVTAAGNTRVARPVYHFTVCWAELERPTDAEAVAAAKECLRALGAEDHQAVIAVHRDRAHVHVHVALNRIHPQTFRALSTSNDYAKLERACRGIEIAQGWAVDRGRFDVMRVDQDCRFELVPAAHWERRREDGKQDRRADATRDLRYQRKTGQLSLAHRLSDGLEAAIRSAITRAISWRVLHHALERLGLLYARHGSGARLHLRGTADFMKPSRLGKGCSLPAVQARLGPYRPAEPSAELRPLPKPEFGVTGSPAPADAPLLRSQGFRQSLRTRLYDAVTSDADSLQRLLRIDLETDVPRFLFEDGMDLRDRGTQIAGAGGASERHKARIIVALAVAKGWASVRLHGSKFFRREALRAAIEAGLAVENVPPGVQERLAGELGVSGKSGAAQEAAAWRRRLAQREGELAREAQRRASYRKERETLRARHDVEKARLRELGRDPVAQALRHGARRRHAGELADLRHRQATAARVAASRDRPDPSEGRGLGKMRRLHLPPAVWPPGEIDHPACRQHWLTAPTDDDALCAAASAWGLSPATLRRLEGHVRPTRDGDLLMAHTDGAGNILGFEIYRRHSDGTRTRMFAKGGSQAALVLGDPRTAIRAVLCGNGLQALTLAEIEHRADTIYVSKGGWGFELPPHIYELVEYKKIRIVPAYEAGNAQIHAKGSAAARGLPASNVADGQQPQPGIEEIEQRIVTARSDPEADPPDPFEPDPPASDPPAFDPPEPDPPEPDDSFPDF